MKISVIVPVHNEEKYIGECIESLLKQSVPADEIIIINNNSTDNTVAIVKKYPVKLLNEKKQGITFARNKGLNIAKYELIARTDADSRVPSNWIKKIKRNFLDTDLIALSGPGKFYDLPKLVKNPRFKTGYYSVRAVKLYNRIVKSMVKHDCLYGPNCIIRKNGWKKIKNEICLNDKLVHEDLDLAIHIAPFGKIKFDPTLIVSTSFRRWKKPDAYIEYLYRGLKSINNHPQFSVGQRSKRLIKQFVTRALLIDEK